MNGSGHAMTSMKLALRLVGAAAVAILAGCQGTGTAFMGSPEGVPITLESIDGAPGPVKTAFTSELAAAATSKKVDLVGSGDQARYRMRGYLSTEANGDGETTLAYVWDVFDAEKRRAKRLTGSSPIRTSGNPWAELDKETLAKLATRSMDEIAEFLAEAKSGRTVTADASGAPGAALGFAPQ